MELESLRFGECGGGDMGWWAAVGSDTCRRDLKVPSAERILTALCPLCQGSAVTQKTSFRDQPRAAPGMGLGAFSRSQVTDYSESGRISLGGRHFCITPPYRDLFF